MSADLFAINPAASVEMHSVDGADYAIVDDFLADPHAVVEFAYANAERFEMPPKSYPGLVMDIGRLHIEPVRRFLRSNLSRQFDFLRGGIELMPMFSMTTLQPDELSNLQRIPHTDPYAPSGRRNYAGLCYLYGNPDLGGTAFYEWRDRKLIEEATALELENPDKALEFLKERFPTYNQPPSYMTDSNEIATRLEVVPARFNRFLFYPGDLLHSAQIEQPEKLTSDLSTGRLTLNCFATVSPRQATPSTQ